MDTITIPSATSTVAGISAYSADFFTEYLPLIWVPLGLAAAAFGLLWLQRKGSIFLRTVMQRGRRRYRGVRRMR